MNKAKLILTAIWLSVVSPLLGEIFVFENSEQFYEVLDHLRETHYPIQLEKLLEEITRITPIEWCCYNGGPKFKGAKITYELVDFKMCETDSYQLEFHVVEAESTKTVTEVKVLFASPLGRFYYPYESKD